MLGSADDVFADYIRCPHLVIYIEPDASAAITVEVYTILATAAAAVAAVSCGPLLPLLPSLPPLLSYTSIELHICTKLRAADDAGCIVISRPENSSLQ